MLEVGRWMFDVLALSIAICLLLIESIYAHKNI